MNHRVILIRPRICERCRYNEADPSEEVADLYQDRYQDICGDCAREMHQRQARASD